MQQESTDMMEYSHQHRVLGRGGRISPLEAYPIPMASESQRWEILGQSGHSNAAAGGDRVQGNESGTYLQRYTTC